MGWFTFKFDSTDLEIIELLRKNARISISKMAEELGLSINSTSARYKKIMKYGLIKKTFIPTFLPQYSFGKSQTYKMQIMIRGVNKETAKLIQCIKKISIKNAQIECWEVIGHFNVLTWIISENPIDFQFIQDEIQNQVGVIEIKAAIITDWMNNYEKLDLEHLMGIKTNG